MVVKPLPLAVNKDLTSLKIEDMLLGMYGQPGAKTFDISYRGTAPWHLVSPPNGSGKIVLYLYDKACDNVWIPHKLVRSV